MIILLLELVEGIYIVRYTNVLKQMILSMKFGSYNFVLPWLPGWQPISAISLQQSLIIWQFLSQRQPLLLQSFDRYGKQHPG